MTGDAAYRTSSLFYPRADITWKGNSSLRCSLPSLPVLTLIRPNYQSLQLLWTPVMRAHTHAVPDMHTLSTRIKTTCICTLSSWSEIYSRIKIKKKKKSLQTIYAAGIAYEWKMWYLYSQQHMYSVCRSTNVEFTAKIIVKQTGWLSAFSWWTRRNLLMSRRQSTLQKFQIPSLRIWHFASHRGAGTSPQYGMFLTRIRAWILGRCQHSCDEPCWCGYRAAN